MPVVHRGLLSPYHDPRRSRLSRYKHSLRPIVLRQFHAHHYGGTFSRRVLDEAGVPAAHQYFVPFSVDSPHFAREADSVGAQAAAANLRSAMNWKVDSPVILFIAQHSWVKGPDIMLEAASKAQKRLPLLKLMMVGSGAMTGHLICITCVMVWLR